MRRTTPATPEPAQQHGIKPDPEEIRLTRNYRGMALQLAQAISTRVPRGDPVHEIDQAAALDAMLRKVDRADRADHVSRPGSEAGLIRLLPHESWTTPETQRLARIVGYVRRTGPLMDIETLEHKRAAVMRHLETPEEPLMGAAEFAEGLRVFTHREFDALSSPDAPWPGSLPARLPLERAVISKRMQAYSVKAEEEKAMAEAREREEAPDVETQRDDALRVFAFGKIETQDLDKMLKLFAFSEIAALRSPDVAMPDTLPEMDPLTRKDIADKLNKALQARSEDGGASGAGGRATPELPGIATPAQPALNAQQAQHRDLALSLSSMISQHIPKDDPVHKMDVELAIRDMFTKAPADVAPGRDPEKIAMQIAQARRRTEVERGIFVKDEKKKEHLEYLLYNPAMRDPAILNAGYSVRQFDARVDKLIAGDKEEITPNSYDRAVADVLSRQNGANALTEVLSKVLEYGVPKDAPTLRAEREEMIDMLVTGIGYLSRPPGDQVNALFAVFAHREVEALLKTDAPLPPSLPEIASQAREMMSTRMRQLFSQVEKYAFTPGHLKALDLVDKQVRRPGLDKGPSRGGPEL